MLKKYALVSCPSLCAVMSLLKTQIVASSMKFIAFFKHFYCIKLCICKNSKNTFVTLLAFLCYVQYASCPNWARVTYAGPTLETSVVD